MAALRTVQLWLSGVLTFCLLVVIWNTLVSDCNLTILPTQYGAVDPKLRTWLPRFEQLLVTSLRAHGLGSWSLYDDASATSPQELEHATEIQFFPSSVTGSETTRASYESFLENSVRVASSTAPSSRPLEVTPLFQSFTPAAVDQLFQDQIAHGDNDGESKWNPIHIAQQLGLPICSTSTSWVLLQVTKVSQGLSKLLKQLSLLPRCIVVVAANRRLEETGLKDFEELLTGKIYLRSELLTQLPYFSVQPTSRSTDGELSSSQRKNLATLYAIHQGAEEILELSDDLVTHENLSALERLPSFKHLTTFQHRIKDPNGVSLVFNPYPEFLPATTTQAKLIEDSCRSNRTIELLINQTNSLTQVTCESVLRPTDLDLWPRGMPISAIRSFSSKWLPNQNEFSESTFYEGVDRRISSDNVKKPDPLHSIGVIQSIIDYYPDLDAIGALSVPFPVRFSPTSWKQLRSLPCGLFAPFNEHATLWRRENFYNMILLDSLPPRVRDVWRAYIAQRLMWDGGLTLGYTGPIFARRSRNLDLAAALASEESRFFPKLEKLLQILMLETFDDDPAFAGDSHGFRRVMDALFTPSRVERLFSRLYSHGLVASGDVIQVQHWLKDLIYMNFKFPMPTNLLWRVNPPYASAKQIGFRYGTTPHLHSHYYDLASVDDIEKCRASLTSEVNSHLEHHIADERSWLVRDLGSITLRPRSLLTPSLCKVLAKSAVDLAKPHDLANRLVVVMTGTLDDFEAAISTGAKETLASAYRHIDSSKVDVFILVQDEGYTGLPRILLGPEVRSEAEMIRPALTKDDAEHEHEHTPFQRAVEVCAGVAPGSHEGNPTAICIIDHGSGSQAHLHKRALQAFRTYAQSQRNARGELAYSHFMSISPRALSRPELPSAFIEFMTWTSGPVSRVVPTIKYQSAHPCGESEDIAYGSTDYLEAYYTRQAYADMVAQMRGTPLSTDGDDEVDWVGGRNAFRKLAGGAIVPSQTHLRLCALEPNAGGAQEAACGRRRQIFYFSIFMGLACFFCLLAIRVVTRNSKGEYEQYKVTDRAAV